MEGMDDPIKLSSLPDEDQKFIITELEKNLKVKKEPAPSKPKVCSKTVRARCNNVL